MWDEFAGVFAVGGSGFGGAITKTGGDTAAESIGECEMVLGIDKELVEEALGFVGDVAVVLLVEASCEDGVGELALVSPML